MTWHADAPLLARYASHDVDQATASSIDVHLLACRRCRAEAARLVDTERTAVIWDDIVDVIDAPRHMLAERLALRLGATTSTARLLAATPSLRLSWFVGAAVTVAFATLASLRPGDNALFPFLLVAPLLPLAGVGFAFGPTVDPAHEIGAATPLAAFRLLLLRAVAVLVSSIAIAGIGALVVAGLDIAAVAWVLPSLALTLSTLVVGTVLGAERAAAALSGLWVFGVFAGAVAANDRLAAFRPGAQVAFALIAALALVAIVWRRDLFDRPARL